MYNSLKWGNELIVGVSIGIEFTLTPIFHVGQHPMTTRSRLLRLLDGAASRFAGAPRPSPGALDPFAGILPWELTSRASLEVPHCERGGGIDAIYASMLLEFAGVCTFRRAIEPSLTARCRTAANALADEVRDRVRAQGLDPDDPISGFRFEGAYQRGPGRVDLRNHAAMSMPPFDDASLCDDAAWMPCVTHMLGSEAHLLWKGLVVTEPG